MVKTHEPVLIGFFKLQVIRKKLRFNPPQFHQQFTDQMDDDVSHMQAGGAVA